MAEGLQLRSLVRPDGVLELSLVAVPVPQPADDEVVIRVEGAPINPSDIGLLTGPADMSEARYEASRVTAPIAPAAMRGLQRRIGVSMPVGNEGAGTVVETGASPAAQALKGRMVATWGGAMYAQYRSAKAADCLVLPPNTTAAEAASCFVNPLTALGMVETMRREGHKALVHTAAASNLGRMLVRICRADGIGLVNIVRSAEQVRLLREAGAKYVLDSSAADFMTALTDALAATKATLAFDAIGGGRLASDILTAMEAAIGRDEAEFNRYGSNVHKQVYIYGSLDFAPTDLRRNYGMAWGIGGWLVWPFLQKFGADTIDRMRARIVAELKTTFASHYTKEISLAEALSPAILPAYLKRATGEKYLLNPNLRP